MIIELLNGARFDVADYNIKRLFHYIPSAEIQNNIVNVEGRSDIILNSKINNRVITVDFVCLSRDIYDFYSIRDRVNALFLRNEAYYIIFKKEPHKRWLVRCNNGYSLQPNRSIESFTIEFITMNAYAESVATTQSIKEWDVNYWSWDNTINWDEELKYSFNTNNFAINNLGNAKIDPRESFLDIEIRGNFEFGVIVRNLSYGTSNDFAYNSPLNSGEVLKLEGIRVLKNGVSEISKTNKRLISLEPGVNEIRIFGGEVSQVNFNFRFLYK